MELMPLQYKHMLGGPSLKVDMHTAAIAEGLLTFLITFIVLFIIIKGPKSLILKALMIAVTTLSMVIAGRGYTGPSMNPANVSLHHNSILDVPPFRVELRFPLLQLTLDHHI